ncbi:ParM/StbA family protein [Candidatus Parcubacteria bacterium]|nr:MAG: ParM/StbA family protein [Candidatus Parcubacteria bacterium]
MNVVAIDLGHSAVKMTFDSKDGGVTREIFPAAACPNFEFSMGEKDERAQFETVEVDGAKFLVGNTALVQCAEKIEDTLKQNWVKTPGHAALLKMAKKIADTHLDDQPRAYVLGLPVKDMADQRSILAEVSSTHLEGEEDKTFVLPQPLGVFYAYSINSNFEPEEEKSEGSWAIVDIGYYSTDFVIVSEGTPVESTADSCDGIRLAVERLKTLLEDRYGIRRSMVAVEKILRRGYATDKGKKIDITKELEEVGELMAERIVDALNKAIPSERIDEANGVLVAGGGTNLIFDHIQSRLPHSFKVEDERTDLDHNGSRYLVSEGYYRFGKLLTSTFE